MLAVRACVWRVRAVHLCVRVRALVRSQCAYGTLLFISILFGCGLHNAAVLSCLAIELCQAFAWGQETPTLRLGCQVACDRFFAISKQLIQITAMHWWPGFRHGQVRRKPCRLHKCFRWDWVVSS